MGEDHNKYRPPELSSIWGPLQLGHGGVEYIGGVLGCDPKTIRQGQTELEEGDDLDTGRVRKKGVAANG